MTLDFFQMTGCQRASGRSNSSDCSCSVNSSRRLVFWPRNGVRSLIASTSAAIASFASSRLAKRRSARRPITQFVTTFTPASTFLNIRHTGVHRYCLRGPVAGIANIALGGQQ
ncbi:hypothetical protein BFG51_15835 [Dietzia alimentaria]|nr:hypothetical protein BFG51_15835 [Dietzia alimentaria]